MGAAAELAEQQRLEALRLEEQRLEAIRLEEERLEAIRLEEERQQQLLLQQQLLQQQQSSAGGSLSSLFGTGHEVKVEVPGLSSRSTTSLGGSKYMQFRAYNTKHKRYQESNLSRQWKTIKDKTQHQYSSASIPQSTSVEKRYGTSTIILSDGENMIQRKLNSFFFSFNLTEEQLF